MRVRAAPAASRGGHDSCVRSFVPTRQRPPCVKGPQGSAACGRTSDRSGPAATCLGGPQRGPGRLSGNPDHRPLRKRAVQMALRHHRTLRERPLCGAGGHIGRPYGGDGDAAVQTALCSRRTLHQRPLTRHGRLIAAPTVKTQTRAKNRLQRPAPFRAVGTLHKNSLLF